jgi:tRNA (guanine-N7-)-methyltransferase
MPEHLPRLVPQDYFRELTLEELFPSYDGGLEVDLGCGDGTFLIEMARAHPERRFLGVERLEGRVSKVERRIRRAGLTNARVLRLESAYTVGWLLPTRSVSRLHLLCPDPWPKKKHHRRRLVIDPEFQNGLRRILLPKGEFLHKTDNEEYYEVTTGAFDSLPDFERLDWSEDAFVYPQTDFEKHWLEQGRSIHRARWRLKVS